MKKRLVLLLILFLCVCAFVFSDGLIRTYVKADRARLAQYAQTLLAGERDDERYGLWKVDCYPEQGVVQFMTGGSGLVPSTTYEGFYYSADDTHIPFQGADCPMTLDGDTASWTDGTDNGGTSVRITEHWFWFEAWF